jgi:GDP-L-fucose synthase
MNKSSKIYIAGHRGMVGSAITRKLATLGYDNLVTREFTELNLLRQMDTEAFFQAEKPDYVFLAAAKVGGILANNTYRAQFIYENLMIQSNVIHAAWKNGVKKLLFLGSSCIYPKLSPQPMKEEHLLTGTLEPTNEPYAIAKIAGIKLCESYNHQYGCNFISVMPTNLYGPIDNFDLETSHVLPAMIRRFHEATINNHAPVTLWGTGTPLREFLHVDDLADAVVYIMQNNLKHDIYNIGAGKDLTIKALAHMIQSITGHQGAINWDTSKPDGTPRKLLDTTRLANEGWTCSIPLEEGIRQTYQWYLEHMKR